MCLLNMVAFDFCFPGGNKSIIFKTELEIRPQFGLAKKKKTFLENFPWLIQKHILMHNVNNHMSQLETGYENLLDIKTYVSLWLVEWNDLYNELTIRVQKVDSQSKVFDFYVMHKIVLCEQYIWRYQKTVGCIRFSRNLVVTCVKPLSTNRSHSSCPESK